MTFIRQQPDLAAGSSSVAVAAADLDGDGNVDLAVANFDSDDVSVFWGKGDGTFVPALATLPVAAPSGTPTNQSPVVIAIDYVTGHQYPDIITANESSSTVSVFPNLGGRQFGTAIQSPTGTSPESLAIGDFNGDKILDVATPNFFDDSVSILLGKGDGSFTSLAVCSNPPGLVCHTNSDCTGGGTCTPQTIPVGAEPDALAAADLNKDGNVDLIVANSSGGPVQAGSLMVLEGTGTGAFVVQPEINSPTFNNPVAIKVAKLNGDDNQDLVVVNDAGDSLSVLMGNGDLTFQGAAALNVSSFSMPEGAVVADFNGDGIPDIATSASLQDKVSVFIGLGNGTFAAPQDVALPTNSTPFGIALGDFCTHGGRDLATANMMQDGTVSVLLNATGVTLAASISAADTTITLTDACPFPASGTLLIGQEQIAYTGKQGNTLSGVSRGVNGTVATDHAQSAAVTGAPATPGATPTQATPTPTATPTVTATPGGTPRCVGDCGGDGIVTVDEVLTMTNIALGSAPVSACLAGDANGDHRITVDEVLTAVNNALNGCRV